MPCDQILNSKNEVIGHFCTTPIESYMVRVRKEGYRKYEIIKKNIKKKENAIKLLGKTFSCGKYKRGDVLACPPLYSYYEPTMVCEIKQ